MAGLPPPPFIEMMLFGAVLGNSPSGFATRRRRVKRSVPTYDAADERVETKGAGNANGDPQKDTLALFVGRTAIVFATDGEQLWVEGER